MNGDRDQRTRELQERLSRLSEASLRITEDLDLDAVLQGVVDAACLLTGARISAMTILYGDGDLQAFITSGMTPEERRRFVELPGDSEIFAHLSALPGPLGWRTSPATPGRWDSPRSALPWGR